MSANSQEGKEHEDHHGLCTAESCDSSSKYYPPIQHFLLGLLSLDLN